MNMNYMNLSLAWMGALNMALALSGCTNGIETGLSAPEGIPVTVFAEISPVTKSGEAISSDNGFDRTSFLSGDQIKVTRTKKASGTAAPQSASYRYDGTSAWTVVGTSPVTLEPAVTYSAQFPADYSAINQFQTTSAAYLASNLLKTGDATSSDGMLDFTSSGKPFTHVNSKLTLMFTVKRETSIANDAVTVAATGIRTAVSTNQTITLYRPYPGDASRKYEWCGILRAVGGSAGTSATDLTVSLTCDGVTYKATLTGCALRTGYHYTYNLTLHNDMLIPESCTIGKWTDEIMAGGNLT